MEAETQKVTLLGVIVYPFSNKPLVGNHKTMQSIWKGIPLSDLNSMVWAVRFETPEIRLGTLPFVKILRVYECMATYLPAHKQTAMLRQQAGVKICL